MYPNRPRQSGMVLPAVLVFLTLAFAVWACLFRGHGGSVQIEEVRRLRQTRAHWTAPAMARGLQLLQTGMPSKTPYQGKLALTQDGQTRWFLLTFERNTGSRWSIRCEPTTAGNPAPLLPDRFTGK